MASKKELEQDIRNLREGNNELRNELDNLEKRLENLRILPSLSGRAGKTGFSLENMNEQIHLIKEYLEICLVIEPSTPGRKYMKKKNS